MEFPPKEHQFSLLLTRKKSSQNAKKFLSSLLEVKTLLFLPLVNGAELAAVDYLDFSSRLPRQEMVSRKLFPLQNGGFCFTGNSQLRHLYRQLLCHSRAPPPSSETKTNKPKYSPKGVDSTTETRKWASASLLWSLKPLISCGYPSFQKGPHPSQLFHGKSPKLPQN